MRMKLKDLKIQTTLGFSDQKFLGRESKRNLYMGESSDTGWVIIEVENILGCANS